MKTESKYAAELQDKYYQNRRGNFYGDAIHVASNFSCVSFSSGFPRGRFFIISQKPFGDAVLNYYING
jgi:hypothetical protein